MPNISQALLYLGFRNLVQTLGMICCVEETITILMLIVPLNVFFLSLKKVFVTHFLVPILKLILPSLTPIECIGKFMSKILRKCCI